MEKNGGSVADRGVFWWQVSIVIKRGDSSLRRWLGPCACHFLETPDMLLKFSISGTSLIGFIVN